MQALVVWAHPESTSFSAALRETASSALARAGHAVEVLDLYGDGFDAVMTPGEWRAYRDHRPILAGAAERYADAVHRAEILTFVYPTWWFGLPAILKGWLEKVLVAGVAFEHTDTGIRGRLHHVRHLVGITTYGSARWEIRLVGDAGRRTLLRTLRVNCSWRCRSTWLALYGMDTAGSGRRRTFLERVDTALGGPAPQPTWSLRRFGGATVPTRP